MQLIDVSRSQDRSYGRLRLRHGLLPVLLALGLAGPVWALEAVLPDGASQPSAATATTGLRVHEGVLNAAGADRVETTVGGFSLSPTTRLYLRHGGAIKRINNLSAHVGSPVSLGIENDKAVWVAVETQETIQ